MSKRRAVTIIIGILILIIAIVGALWQRSRTIALKNGTDAPTFREFIGLGGKSQSSTGANGDLSSEFTDPTAGSGTDSTTDGMNIGDGGQVTVSSFTSDTISPIGGGFGAGTQGSGSGSGGGSGTPPILTTSGTGGGIITDTMAGCSDADTNIAFTPTEKADLDRLRARFERIASFLHNSTDANQERDNFDEYRQVVERAGELTSWCQNKAPIFTAPELKVKVATPFWHETGDALRYFLTTEKNLFNACFVGGWFHVHGQAQDGVNCNIFENPINYLLEDALRLNLW